MLHLSQLRYPRLPLVLLPARPGIALLGAALAARATAQTGCTAVGGPIDADALWRGASAR